MTGYRDLAARVERIGAIEEALAILHWDAATMMPEGAGAARGEQIATLETLAHERLTDSGLEASLDAADAEAGLDPWQRANIAEARRRWLHATAVPTDLVAARAKACVAAELIWRRARERDDFAAVLPSFRTLLDLTREVAAAKAARLGVGTYDALLDEYEPGGRAAEIDALFAELETFLPAMIGAAIERQSLREAPVAPTGPFAIEAQRALGVRLMKALGFDFAHGRLDVSAHPFTGGVPDDVRITTRYREDSFHAAVMAILHETGHALYERGLPAAWRRQPVGAARGMSLHESQSLLIEMQACRSREFMEFLAPVARASFAAEGPAWTADNLHRLALRVRRGFIRVDADEVTYPMHVILRYRLERALLSGDLQPADLPGAWRDGMRAAVGVAPASDREGCLQDIHWFSGAIGYFPTYTLGALTAAQLFAAATEADAAIRPGLAAGDFAPLLDWLRRHVHSRGSSVTTGTIIENATGKPLGTEAFRRHLEGRYLN